MKKSQIDKVRLTAGGNSHDRRTRRRHFANNNEVQEVMAVATEGETSPSSRPVVVAAEKPEGRFRCCVCQREWDGSQLYDDSMSTAHHWTCGNLACGGNVRKVSPVAMSLPEMRAAESPKPSLPRRVINTVNRWVDRLCSHRNPERQQS